ncbi:20361_t:CDS:2, partial [Rhizophagus irregularis]
INIIYQLERILLIITVPFSGIALSISLFVLGILINITSKKILVKITEIYSVIVIILISNVFLVIQKCSKKLYVLFYLAIIIEIVLLFVMLIGYNYPSIILSNNINDTFTSAFRVEIFIITLVLFFLIILIINTRLCQNYIDENVILQRKKSKSDESYLKRLGNNAWKFIPESRFLLLNIIKIDDEIVRVDNKDPIKKKCPEIVSKNVWVHPEN